MDETKQVIPAASHDAQSIALILCKAKHGDIVSYLEMSEAIGRNVQKEARSALDRARRIVERQHGLVFRPVLNVGMRCLPDIDTAKTATSALTRIRNTAKRAVKTLKTIKSTEGWKLDDVADLNVKTATLNYVYNTSSTKSLMAVKEKLVLANNNPDMSKAVP
jgi:hypothetical protein